MKPKPHESKILIFSENISSFLYLLWLLGYWSLKVDVCCGKFWPIWRWLSRIFCTLWIIIIKRTNLLQGARCIIQFQFQMDCFLTLFSPWHLLSFQAKAVLLVVAWKKKTKVLPHLYQMKMRILKVGKNWKFWFVRINWCVLT